MLCIQLYGAYPELRCHALWETPWILVGARLKFARSYRGNEGIT